MLTPVDIENKEFEKAFRGYDIDDVEEFMQTVVNDYEKLYRENANLKEKNAMLSETIKNYKGMEETMQNAIVAAQRTAEDIKKNAYERAENIMQEAQIRANDAIANADKTIQDYEKTYVALHGKMDTFRAQMSSLLNTYMELLQKDPDYKPIDRVSSTPVQVPPPEAPKENKDVTIADLIAANEAARKAANEAKNGDGPRIMNAPPAASGAVSDSSATRPASDGATQIERDALEMEAAAEAPSKGEEPGVNVKKHTFDTETGEHQPPQQEVVINVKTDDESDGYFDVFKDDSL